ncbi:hypothetical protein EV659_107141 [Rhodothalassium salexigens DSM 2132]|uniref:DUF3108 domain-containing protein n=2 Tax=Rhodothalassium salexigens TaxID=1086 RepID=A0A4R2PE75_RHOSA|nr:hypothetical protein EV659_107141 [Rhodothalassium salexigens DSM 2132]
MSLWRMTVLLFVCIGALAACDRTAGRYPLSAGLSATIDINGTAHEMYVSKVTGKVAHISFYRRGTLSNHRKYYRGLFVTEAIDKSFHWINEFDSETVEALFPLRVGAETRFESRFRVVNQDIRGSIRVAMRVEDKTSVRIAGTEYEAFVIAIRQERTLKGGRTLTLYRQATYAPALGLSVRTVDREGESIYTTRILDLDRPRPPGRRNTLGTMVI